MSRRFLPALLLARVDGKSPVEYLSERRDQDFVRSFAKRFLAQPVTELSGLAQAWRKSST